MLRNPCSVYYAGVLAFTNCDTAKTRSKQELILIARLAGCKKGGHIPFV